MLKRLASRIKRWLTHAIVLAKTELNIEEEVAHEETTYDDLRSDLFPWWEFVPDEEEETPGAPENRDSGGAEPPSAVGAVVPVRKTAVTELKVLKREPKRSDENGRVPDVGGHHACHSVFDEPIVDSGPHAGPEEIAFYLRLRKGRAYILPKWHVHRQKPKKFRYREYLKAGSLKAGRWS